VSTPLIVVRLPNGRNAARPRDSLRSPLRAFSLYPHAEEHCKIVEINAFQLNNPPISLLKMELKNLGLLRKNTRKFTFASPTLKKITQ
jgi:hypothetical protein